jgi:membrane protease subunit (stomatin/prohibitin family)
MDIADGAGYTCGPGRAGQPVPAAGRMTLTVMDSGGVTRTEQPCPRGVADCDGTSCTWKCPDCGCMNCHEAFCYQCGAGDPAELGEDFAAFAGEASELADLATPAAAELWLSQDLGDARKPAGS